jgi:uroporphyrin-III C-methyltransferase/precorrin-2 dehydrogenase/sirohydrochlorin ferrochelatase
VLLVGAGRVAAAKIPRLVDAGAVVVVVAPEVLDEIATFPVEIHRRAFVPADLVGVWYVVSAAPPAVNASVAYQATMRGIFVNAVDDPRHATVFAGSVLTRGPVTVAISTGGEAPALARVMREALDRVVGRDVEDWTALAASLRQDWKRERVPMERRRDALVDAIAQLARERDSSALASETQVPRGFVSLVGAGPNCSRAKPREGSPKPTSFSTMRWCRLRWCRWPRMRSRSWSAGAAAPRRWGRRPSFAR